MQPLVVTYATKTTHNVNETGNTLVRTAATLKPVIAPESTQQDCKYITPECAVTLTITLFSF